MKLTLLFLLLSFISSAQPKKANTIIVKGVQFKEVANALLDAGYEIAKSDSSLGTIKTEYKLGTGELKYVKVSIFVRIKDSVATITGKWYNTIVMNAFASKFTTEDNESLIVQNTNGGYKLCFQEMNKLALSFNKPVEYLIK